MRPTFDSINDSTGFANGDKFANEAEVRDYFTMPNMRHMFGNSPANDLLDQDVLDGFAEAVIENRWWMVSEDSSSN